MNRNSVNHRDYAIVIMSCDSYSDVWPYFSACWHKYWADCPFDTYLISEIVDFRDEQIKNIKIGRRVVWGDMMLEVLNRLPHANIIYMQEDYLLKSRVDNAEVEKSLLVYETEQAAYLRLFPWPNPDQPLENHENIGVIGQGLAYRTSLQCAVWNTEVLRSLVHAGESGWDFEGRGVERSSAISKPFLGVFGPVDHRRLNDTRHVIDYFATGVLHGRWMRECLKFFREQGTVISPGKRGVLSRWDYFYYEFRKRKKSLVFQLLDRYFFRSAVFNWLHYVFLRFFNRI